VSAPRSSRRPVARWLALGLLVASCYTGPVNRRPTLQIISPPKPFSRGESPVFTAIVDDPEGQPYELAWGTTPECPSAGQEYDVKKWPETWTMTSEFSVDPKVTAGPFCLWARATDSYGAKVIVTAPKDPTNHPPVAKLTRTPATSAVALRTPIEYSALGSSDADGDQVRVVAWYFDQAPVPVEDRNGLLADCPDRNKQCFVPEVPGEYTVTVRVTDGIDEVSSTSNTVVVQPGNVPIARLELKSPTKAQSYPLGTTFHISGAKSSDGDPMDKLTATWDKDGFLAEAPTSIATLEPCEGDTSELERCFRADAPGTYRVSLTVNDGLNNSVPEVMELVVRGDDPPCLRVTSPEWSTETVPAEIDPMKPTQLFSVLRVDDDLDPFPRPAGASLADQTLFQWSVDDGSGFKHAWDSATFRLATDGYEYGDEVSVRLEIFDRVTVVNRPPCNTAICQTSPTCVQRVTWKVKFLF
jgi:hypothetical protein